MLTRISCWAFAVCLFTSVQLAKADDKVAAQLKLAAENRLELELALSKSPPSQASSMRFLIENMPPRDLVELSSAFLLENCKLAHEAREETSWAANVPEEVFLNYVLPYANINERRSQWRAKLRKICLPLIKDARSTSEAAVFLNQKLFPLVKVRYSTKRRRADQDPLETMKSGLASCTGLSILLIDACRSVGVPARFVGTPLWTNNSGNHSWVEIWDNGWHFTGAAEPSGSELNKGWFVGNASKAKRDSKLNAIYAVSFKKTPISFPLVWDRSINYVSALNVTNRYTALANELPDGMGIAKFMTKTPAGDRCCRPIKIVQNGKTVFEGQTNDERFDMNDHLTVPLRLKEKYSVYIGQEKWKEIELKSDEKLYVFESPKK